MSAFRAALVAVSTGGLALLPVAAFADTLIDNVAGRTIGHGGQIETFTGVLIDHDGRIKAILHHDDKRPAKVDYRLDAGGKVLLPGMVDAHVKLMETGFAALTLNVANARSLSEVQDMVRAYAAQHPDRAWIIGYGWNEQQWGGDDGGEQQPPRLPTAADLDAAVSDRPVWLVRVDGQAGWANTAALTAAGVTNGSTDPAGGRIERTATKAPAGALIGSARELVEKAAPAPRPAERDLAFRTAQALFLKHGVTAVADMGTTIADWQTYRRAGDNGQLQLRIMAYAAGVDAMSLVAGPAPTRWLYDDRLRLNGVKFTIDGALALRSALLKQPYSDAPNQRGMERQSATALRNLMSRAAMDGFQIAVGATGDGANAEVLAAIGELAETYKGDRRWRIEHATVVDPADMAGLGTLGIIASVQPQQRTADQRVTEARLGQGRLPGAYGTQSLAAAGARLAFGSDAPTYVPNPFAGMAAALSGEGDPAGSLLRLETQRALAAYTFTAAYAGFGEDRFGRIAPGLRADFILVDKDPMTASPHDLRETRVLETWIAGRKVYDSASGSGSDRSSDGNKAAPAKAP